MRSTVALSNLPSWARADSISAMELGHSMDQARKNKWPALAVKALIHHDMVMDQNEVYKQEVFKLYDYLRFFRRENIRGRYNAWVFFKDPDAFAIAQFHVPDIVHITNSAQFKEALETVNRETGHSYLVNVNNFAHGYQLPINTVGCILGRNAMTTAEIRQAEGRYRRINDDRFSNQV